MDADWSTGADGSAASWVDSKRSIDSTSKLISSRQPDRWKEDSIRASEVPQHGSISSVANELELLQCDRHRIDSKSDATGAISSPTWSDKDHFAVI